MKQQLSPAVAGGVIAVIAVVAIFFVMRAFGGPGKTPPKPVDYSQRMQQQSATMGQNMRRGGSMGGAPQMGGSMGGAPR